MPIIPASATVPPTMTTCPDENRLVEYVEGLLVADQQRTIDLHVDRCEACRRLLARFALGSRAPEATEAHPSTELAAGIAGRYDIVRVLGSGAMSIVYEAHDRSLDRKVALKVLRDTNPGQADTLAREARTMARLAHPNVVPVYDVGTAGGRMFLIAELVVGETVASWMRGTKHGWDEVVRVFVQAGRGLAAAHAAGITHRDFKPSNMLIGADGRVRITDFGLARRTAVEPGDLSLVRAGELIGTPAYMAPEQLAGASADARSDQFAFCASLFEALHGERPFQAASVTGLRVAIERGERVRGRGARIPSRLARVIERGLALDPNARASSMDDIVDELEAVLGRGRLRGTIYVAAIGVVLLVGAAIVFSIRRDEPAAPVPGLAHDSIDGRLAVAALDAAPEAEVAPEAAVDASTGSIESPRHASSRRPDAGAPGLGSYHGVDVEPRHGSALAADVAAKPPTDAGVDGAVQASSPGRRRTTVSHPIAPGHRPAILAAFATLGFRGVRIDSDHDANVAELRRMLAAVPPDDRRNAVAIQVALGVAYRKHGDCTRAMAEFRVAVDETAKADEQFVRFPFPKNVDYRRWWGRALFGIALCKVAVDAPDALQALERALDAMTAETFEIKLALGIFLWETGATDRFGVDGPGWYLVAGQTGDAAVRSTLKTWATAVGAPLE